jgi:NADH-quinone oxidoreductase subunit A
MTGAISISFLAIFLVILFALGLALVILLVNQIFGERPREVAPKKGDTYECGVPYEGNARQPFSVRYYLIGIIFLLFDVEVVLMYPWARVFKDFLPQGLTIVIDMLIFIFILLAGYIYLRRRKALDCD